MPKCPCIRHAVIVTAFCGISLLQLLPMCKESNMIIFKPPGAKHGPLYKRGLIFIDFKVHCNFRFATLRSL